MPAKRRVTRRSEKFGCSPADLPTSDLSTYQDVTWFIYKLKDADCIKDKQDILKIVSQELEKIWIKCNPSHFIKWKKYICQVATVLWQCHCLEFYDNVIAWNSTKGCFQIAGIDKHSKAMPLTSPILLEPFNSSPDIPVIQQLNSSIESMQVITKYLKLTNVYFSFKQTLKCISEFQMYFKKCISSVLSAAIESRSATVEQIIILSLLWRQFDMRSQMK